MRLGRRTRRDGAAPVERFIEDVLPNVPRTPARAHLTNHMELMRGAAEERGLTIQKIADTTYFYDGRIAVGSVHKHRMTSLVAKNAILVCDSKVQTKQMLQAAGVPVPVGFALTPDQLDEGLVQLRAMRTAVLKPSYGMRGRGITCAITSRADLETAWETATQALQPRRDTTFLLEEQISGIDIRVFVVGTRAVAATTRVPFHVVGDGRLSISDLIEAKREQRLTVPYLAAHPPIVETALLERSGRTLDGIPADGEIVVLTSLANISVGGENVDVTDLVHPDLLDVAVAATRAVPGLHVAGVDLMARNLGTVKGAVVLELNAGANVDVHHCPTRGLPRDVAGAIVDEMISRSRCNG